MDRQEMDSQETHLQIGMLIFPRVDQIDFTGPFEVFASLPNATVHVLWKDKTPLRDIRGLLLTPQTTLDESPPLDVLHVPGGYGQEALMDDEVVLAFLRKQMQPGRHIFSVCTGALLCGAAGLLRGRRATTHWASLQRMRELGDVEVVEARIVRDGKIWTSAGISAGIDLILAFIESIAGEETAGKVQFGAEYYPSGKSYGGFHLLEQAPQYMKEKTFHL